MEVKPGYKESEVGVIPEHWDAAHLGDKTTKVGSGITPTGGARVYKQEGRPFLRSQNVGWGNLLLDDVAFIDDETHATFRDTEIEADDVFLNITGASIGRSAVADARVQRGNVNQHVCIIRTNRAELHPRFLNYFLLSAAGQRQIDSFQAGGNRQGLNFGQVRSFRLPLPPPPEQRAIAEALSDADALIESLEQLLTKKRQLKQGAMQELLTGKERLPGFSGEWEMKSVGELGDCFAGGTPSTFRREYWGGEICWLPSGRVQNCILDCPAENETRLTKRGLDESAAKRIKAHSVLVAITGATCANVACLEFEASANQSVVAIEPNSTVNYRYVYYSMLMERNTILSLQSGSAQGGVNLKAVKSIPLRLPSLPEQTAIAAILSDMDAEIAALETKLAKTRQLKQGMMQELLTGRIRLV